MKRGFLLVTLALLTTGALRLAANEVGMMHPPKTIVAGTGFSIPTSGDGEAALYIVGPAQVIRRNIKLGETVTFAASDLVNAGHYSVSIVSGSFSQSADMDVLSAPQAASISLLAKPSRLPVDRPQGISGVAYVFDTFRNLILQNVPVEFQLSVLSGAPSTQTVETKNGVAWIRMNSGAKAGIAQLQAHVESVSEKRVLQEVPSEPCRLKMTAQGAGEKIKLQTDPLRDCSGNAVPDGTVVTFTETYPEGIATVDVPLKRGIAQTEMPAHPGAVISVATGVVLGNEIHWGGAR